MCARGNYALVIRVAVVVSIPAIVHAIVTAWSTGDAVNVVVVIVGDTSILLDAQRSISLDDATTWRPDAYRMSRWISSSVVIDVGQHVV